MRELGRAHHAIAGRADRRPRRPVGPALHLRSCRGRAGVGDAAGLLKRYGYDELGRVSAVHGALGIATAFAYDSPGLLASRTDTPPAATT